MSIFSQLTIIAAIIIIAQAPGNPQHRIPLLATVFIPVVFSKRSFSVVLVNVLLIMVSVFYGMIVTPSASIIVGAALGAIAAVEV